MVVGNAHLTFLYTSCSFRSLKAHVFRQVIPLHLNYFSFFLMRRAAVPPSKVPMIVKGSGTDVGAETKEIVALPLPVRTALLDMRLAIVANRVLS
jgi:hypothetical protein